MIFIDAGLAGSDFIQPGLGILFLLREKLGCRCRLLVFWGLAVGCTVRFGAWGGVARGGRGVGRLVAFLGAALEQAGFDRSGLWVCLRGGEGG